MTPKSSPIREQRTALTGSLTFAYGTEHTGTAQWRNISRTGAQVRMGRFLRPGRTLRLQFDSPLQPGRLVEVEARIVWCSPKATTHQFNTGIAILRQDPETALDFAVLGQHARREANNSSTPKVLPVVWSHFGTEENTKPRAAAGNPS
jgi:hypothetical protein